MMTGLFFIVFLTLILIVALYVAFKPAYNHAMANRRDIKVKLLERQDRAKARWYPENRISGNRQYTDAFVILRTPNGVVLEERQVGTPISNTDVKYDALLYEAMDNARLRAMTLNIQQEAIQ